MASTFDQVTVCLGYLVWRYRRWTAERILRVTLLSGIAVVGFGLPLAASRQSQDTTNERVVVLRGDLDALRKLNLDVRVALLEREQVETKWSSRAILGALFGQLLFPMLRQRRDDDTKKIIHL